MTTPHIGFAGGVQRVDQPPFTIVLLAANIEMELLRGEKNRVVEFLERLPAVELRLPLAE